MKTIEQIRARMGEIANQLVGFGEGVDYTEEQIAQVEQLNGEFETLEKQLATAERVEAMKAKSSASAGRQTAPAAPSGAPRIEVVRDLSARFGGFRTAGEFFMAVKDASHGKVAPQFSNATMYEKNGEDGGFLIPEEMGAEIIKKMDVAEALLPKTRQFTVGGNNLTLNVDENQPWNQGVVAYWTAEGAPMTGSKNAFKQASWKVNKLTALVVCTDELLDDAPAMASYIGNAAPTAIVQKVNEAIVSGNGAGKPQGFLNSPFRVTVAAEGGQAADTIVARNVIKMYSAMIPSARANAAWYINAGAEPQLYLMKDDLGNFIYLAPGSQMNQSPYGLLLGRPVIPMLSALPQLGDEGDIVFADLSYYYSIVKAGGVKSAQSIHLYFDKEQTAFRFSMRLDGKVPFQSPVTTQYGNYQVSGIVTLAAR